MPMESLGGQMPAGRPAAVVAGGRTHVFAIAAGGDMNHWSSANGVDWTAPTPLVRFGGINLEPSYPCAITIGNTAHIFAINHGDGALVHWFSPDGVAFLPPLADATWPIPGGANGVAVTSSGPGRVDAFAVTPSGIIRYTSSSAALAAALGPAPLPSSTGLPRCVPAAASSGTNNIDVFAVHADGSALRWNTADGLHWTNTVLPRPAGAPAGPLVRGGFAAVSPGAGKVEVFAVTTTGALANWSIDGATVRIELRAAPPMTLNDSVPAAIVAADGHIEVFAIGQPPNPFSGGPLIRWRRDRDTWSGPIVIGANLAAGGLGAAAGPTRVEAFGFNSGTNNSLLHWPGGVSAATTEPWANWANSLQTNVVGHCHPNTAEEVVAIVKTAEKVPGARVRAVGSSWSFPDIAMTPSFLVETNALHGLITHVIDRSVLTEHAPDPKYLVHAEAGIQVESLMTRLDGLGLAPFTMGGSSGQTLAGVISTSVHGSNWNRGPIPNAVRAIELVGPGGVRHWVEPDRWRITNEGPLRARLGPDVQIHYDDDWFDSVLVSVGSMGIITSVVLEATDQYRLKKSCVKTTWSALRHQLDPRSPDTVFGGDTSYVMVAIDPAELGHQTSYLTTHTHTTEPTTPPSGAIDPLAAFCQVDIPKLVDFLASNGVPREIAGVAYPAAPFLAALAALPGGVSDWLGMALNGRPTQIAQLVTYLTETALLPGKTQVGDAHKIMAPANPGECAVRGLGLEMAFDTSKGQHLDYVDAMRAALDVRLGQGMVLGGYISLRFVGPSRAILSPQQSALTCMIEITGIRSLTSTKPLLDELEKLGKQFGSIQHWGMFSIPNLAKSDLQGAYPRLDTWRRVHRDMSNGGAIQTFQNAFSTRVGLDDAPAGVPLVWQDQWRWCSKCMGMAFGGGAPGPCPAGGTHDHGGSGDYGFAHRAPSAPGQRDWRWCSKCMGMTFAGAPLATCPAGGTHDLGSSGEYTVLRNGQPNWRRCARCQSLCLADGVCPTGGSHDLSASSDHWLAFTSLATSDEPGWRWCDHCQGLSHDDGVCEAGVPHSLGASAAYSVPVNMPTAPGEAHWRRCRRCGTLSLGAGACFAGPDGPSRASGRAAASGLSRPGRAGAALVFPHDLVGSGDYTVRESAGQGAWRRCTNCQGLWFSGAGTKGICPVQPAVLARPQRGGLTTGPGGAGPISRGAAPAGHEPAPEDEYFVPWR